MEEFGLNRFSAVILAGGTAERLGGLNKAQLVVGGQTLLESALRAVHEAVQIVIVGPETGLLPRRSDGPDVSFASEDPPSGGPAAGLLAGLDALTSDVGVIVVLAVDMPGVTADTVRRLIDARGTTDGAFLQDRNGRRQLAGVLDVRRLNEVRPSTDLVSGLPIHRLLAPLRLTEVPGDDSESHDIDSPDDLPR